MFTLTGGQKVAGGTYWDITTGLRVDMDQEGVLPGGNSSKYIKASSGAMLLAGPILGLIYIITLPIMGVVTALFLLAQRTFSGILSLTRNIVHFGWRPSESYLGGKDKKKNDDRSEKPQQQ